MNQDILLYLQNAAKNKALAHGHALIGPASSGGRELVENFLKDFFGTRSLAHPDIRLLEPEDDVITIGAIRQARSWLSLTPIASDKKALVIIRAECMNKESQNAFLKILEEPSGNTFVFLLASHRKRILATIYSRVVALYCSGRGHTTPPTNPEHLIHSLLAADTIPERMRVWLSASIPKEEIRSWLSAALPKLADELRLKRSRTLALGIRNLIAALGRPSGQNWQLAAEQLIISL